SDPGGCPLAGSPGRPPLRRAGAGANAMAGTSVAPVRTAMKPIHLALGLSLLVAASGAAQSRGLREVRGWGFGGGGVMVGIPVGAFRNFVDVAGGLGGVIAVNLDRRGAVGLRLTGSYLQRSEEHTSELQSRGHLVCRLLLEKKNKIHTRPDSYGLHTVTAS